MADEKFDEKEMEKKEEKGAEEKWRRDPLGSIIWALILIWAGVVFLLDNLGYLDSIKETLSLEGIVFWPFGAGVWGLILLGAGVILLGEVFIRLVIPAYRRPVTGTIILAFIFIGLGLSNMISWTLIWALVLIAIGLSIIVRGLTSRR
jgi:vacuolar-type H+-ATPase subunit I/STV1